MSFKLFVQNYPLILNQILIFPLFHKPCLVGNKFELLQENSRKQKNVKKVKKL